MSVELRPLGVLCNIQCQYCYQNPQRDAANLSSAYDMAKMKEAIRAEGGPFSLFGGEPLLVPLADLEDLWSWGLAKFGHNSVQTNGTLITDAHIRLFKKYRVQVGISLDGPGPLNDARWHGSLERTREATAKAEAVIDQLCREGIPPSLILTLHRANGTADKLPILFDWVRYLDRIGVRWARLHLLESESEAVRAKYALTNQENIEALIGFAELQRELRRLNFDLFEDMRRMLGGRDEFNDLRMERVRPVHHARRSRRRGPRAAEQLRADQQGRHRFRQVRDPGVRALPRPLPTSAGGGRMPWVPLLPYVQGPVPGDRD